MIKVGDQVVHKDSGWAGEVLAIADHDGGQGQGPLVTVRPTSPKPKEYADGTQVGDEWQGWKPIEVTADELEVIPMRVWHLRSGQIVEAEPNENAEAAICVRTSALMFSWGRDEDAELILAVAAKHGLPDTSELDREIAAKRRAAGGTDG